MECQASKPVLGRFGCAAEEYDSPPPGICRSLLSAGNFRKNAYCNSLDDFVSPTEGMTFGSSLEYAGLGGFTKYARVEGRVRYFIPGPDWLPKRSTFMIGGASGSTSSMPCSSRRSFSSALSCDSTERGSSAARISPGLLIR